MPACCLLLAACRLLPAFCCLLLAACCFPPRSSGVPALRKQCDMQALEERSCACLLSHNGVNTVTIRPTRGYARHFCWSPANLSVSMMRRRMINTPKFNVTLKRTCVSMASISSSSSIPSGGLGSTMLPTQTHHCPQAWSSR